MKKKAILLIAFILLWTMPYRVNAMQIFVKLNADVKYSLEVESSTIIIEIKEKINNNKEIPKDYQIFLFNNTILEDTRTLVDYNIQKSTH